MESLIDIDDHEEEGEEEDEDDDTIYECPGLAPPGEMTVTNPFFLSRHLDQLTGGAGGVGGDLSLLPPCPVNNNNNMKHGNINIGAQYHN